MAVEMVQENNPYYGDSDEETEYVFATDTNADVLAGADKDVDGAVVTTENAEVSCICSVFS